MSATFKTLIASTAVVAAGIAFAQSNPPNSAATNPAVGAGQQSTQNTPMGTTGTPGGNAGMTTGSTSASAMAPDTTVKTTPMRKARADRN